MFKNRVVQIKVVPEKTQPTHHEDVFIRRVDLDQVFELGKEIVTHTTITAGIAYAGYKVLNTICNVIEIAAKAKFR